MEFILFATNLAASFLSSSEKSAELPQSILAGKIAIRKMLATNTQNIITIFLFI